MRSALGRSPDFAESLMLALGERENRPLAFSSVGGVAVLHDPAESWSRPAPAGQRREWGPQASGDPRAWDYEDDAPAEATVALRRLGTNRRGLPRGPVGW